MTKVADANKRKTSGQPHRWKKGDPSPNPAGRPRAGLSWAEILEEIGNLDGKQALERAGRIFGELRKYPEGVTLKELSAISYFIRMINDPNGSLLNAVADRTDGKVTVPVDVTTDGDKITKVEFDYGKLIGSVAPRPDEDPETPSEDESGLHGETMGQDNTGGNAGAGSS